jgi:ATP-binding cassette, subfamily B, bacterial PglK
MLISKDLKLNILRLWQQFSIRRKTSFIFLLVLMVITSFAEVVSIGAVLPFLGIITAPDTIVSNPYVLPIINFMQIESLDEVRLWIVIVFILAAITAGALKILLLSVSTTLLFSAGIDLSVKIFKNSLSLSYEEHVQRNSSDVVNVVFNKCNDVIYGIMLPIATLVSSIILISGVISILILINPIVMLISFLVFTIIYALILSFTGPRVKSNSAVISLESTKAIKCIQESLGSIRDVIISNTHAHFSDVYEKSITKMRFAQRNNTFIGAAPRFAIETAGIVLIAGLALLLSADSGGVASAVPILGTLAIGAQRILPTLQQCYGSITSIRSVEAPLSDVLNSISKRNLTKLEKNTSDQLKFKDTIVFENVNYKYSSRSKNSLENISFSINKGDCIGIVGTTGSGKSTLLDIFMGLITPTEGSIFVDGISLNASNITSWQSTIAHVPQNIYFADASIMENIAFGCEKSTIDMDRVISAVQIAQMSSDIDAIEGKYKAPMGENGVMLSGGQRQRLSIARALYRNSCIIVFDEATSALDAKTESNLINSIKNMKSRKTIIMVAHRHESLKNCNKIIRIEKGQLHSIK